MPFNPGNERSIKRLREAMRWSSEKLKPFRQDYLACLREYVGHYYGDGGTQQKVPINMLRLAVEIYARSLSAKAPRALVLTDNLQLRPQAYELQMATDQAIRELNLHDTIKEAVKQALFSIGIIKIGLTPTDLAEAENYLFDGGQPFAESVLFDDWLHDMTAKRYEQVSWCGNKYRLPLEMVMDSPLFDKAAKDNLQAHDGAGALSSDDRHASSLSQGEEMDREEYEDHVDLWDIWLPRENLILTLSVDNEDGLPLRVVEWDGPETGPFELLSFSKVPGNLMPSPPVNHLVDLHQIINTLTLKMGRQAERQKTVVAASGQAVADGSAANIVSADDGGVVQCNHPDQVKEYKFGGVDPQSAQFSILAQERFSYQAGNLDVMGGLSQQAQTATQEKILKASSSLQMDDMQDEVVRFAARAVRGLAWHIYHDPVSTRTLSLEIPGYGRAVQTEWGPERREADFFEFNFRVEPYSMQPRGPSERLAAIVQIVTQLAMPGMQAGALTLDWGELMNTVANYADLPELRSIVQAIPPQLQQALMQQQQQGKPPVTTRNYTRTNVPTGGTQQSRNATMMQAFMGGKPQVNAQQAAAMARR